MGWKQRKGVAAVGSEAGQFLKRHLLWRMRQIKRRRRRRKARLSIWMRVRMGKRVRYFAITIKEPEGRSERARGD